MILDYAKSQPLWSCSWYIQVFPFASFSWQCSDATYFLHRWYFSITWTLTGYSILITLGHKDVRMHIVLNPLKCWRRYVIYFAHPVSIYHLKLFHHNVSNFVFKLWSCTLSRVIGKPKIEISAWYLLSFWIERGGQCNQIQKIVASSCSTLHLYGINYCFSSTPT